MSNVKKNLWKEIKKPIFVLAPLANVTDASFRRIIAKYGKPDVLWAEFVSADGLISKGREVLINDLIYTEEERPIIAQLFTANPEVMKKAAALVQKLGFDGLDINMGCPDRAIERQCAGAAHMKNFKLSKEIILAAREGAPDLPISVKTRIGFNKIEIDKWIVPLLELHLPVLTVHLRTRKEMSKVAAHWEVMPEILKLRDEISPETLIIGNGDVATLTQAKEKVKKYGCDGVMIGRGIFGNPWFFSGKDINKITPRDKIEVLLEHAELFNNLLGKVKSFAFMKKHFKAYISGWDGAKDLRNKMMEVNDFNEFKKVVEKAIAFYS